VPKTVRSALSGTIGGGEVWLTRFYTQYTGTAPSNAQLHTYDAALASAYTADLASLVDGASTLTQIESVDLSSATSAVDTSAESIAGTRSGAEVPAIACTVVSYEISRRYRGGHPRGYWRMGIANDLSDEGHWTSGFLSSVLSGLNAFYTAVVAAGWSGAGTLSHVNVSYYSGFTVVVNPITGRARNVPTVRVSPLIDAVTSIIPRSSIGTQRRRGNFFD
jgi:hypothetical protein